MGRAGEAPGAALISIKDSICDYFKSENTVVHGAVYGQRWVDIAGVNLMQAKRAGATGKGPDCFNGIAQDPDEVQHDHYLRQRNEAGWEGALRAIADSNARFKKYFVRAATAKGIAVIRFRDGGVQEEIQYAPRHYFLFGRAVHLFQDSFSPEHAVRSIRDGYRKVLGIKSYVCTLLSDQHTRHLPITLAAKVDRLGLPFLHYGDDDVIWRDPISAGRRDAAGLSDANIKPAGLAAIEASKDLWAAFLRVMGEKDERKRAAAAASEADTLIRNWLTPDENAIRARYPSNRTGKYANGQVPSGPGWVVTLGQQEACDGIKPPERRTRLQIAAAAQKQCRANIVPSKESTGERDEVFGIPYDWTFKKETWDAVPARN